MLVAKNVITHDYYLKVRLKGVTIFLYNEIDFIPPSKEETNEVFFNCSSQRVESTWYTWAENDKLIQEFKRKFPQFFEIRAYDLTLAIQKAMYWSNFKTGFLLYSLKKYFPNEKVFFAEPMHQSGSVGAFLRYLKSITNNSIKKSKNVTNIEDNKFIYLTHLFLK